MASWTPDEITAFTGALTALIIAIGTVISLVRGEGTRGLVSAIKDRQESQAQSIRQTRDKLTDVALATNAPAVIIAPVATTDTTDTGTTDDTTPAQTGTNEGNAT